MKVCLGGTFSPFHAGHRRLLQTALDAGDEVFVGITSDAFAGRRRERRVEPFAARQRAVEEWVGSTGWQGRLVAREIANEFGASTEPGYDILVVSEETAGAGERINAKRAEKGLQPLRVVVVPYATGDDLLPIKATRIARGDIDVEGRRLAPLRVAAGTTNPAKLDGVREGFERLLPGVPLALEGFPVEPGVAEQPWGEDAANGAAGRARALVRSEIDGKAAEYLVGVEAGLVDMDGLEGPLDVQYVCIRDAWGEETTGTGPGFRYPDPVLDAVRGGASVGEAVGALSKTDDIGRREGAVGWLTKGRYTRRTLTAQAVIAALVPRVRRELYRRP